MGEVIYMPLEIDPNVFLHPKGFENVGKTPLYLAACNEMVLDDGLSAEANILMEHFLAMLAGRRLCVGIMSLACALSCLMGNALAATGNCEIQTEDGMIFVMPKGSVIDAKENLP